MEEHTKLKENAEIKYDMFMVIEKLGLTIDKLKVVTEKVMYDMDLSGEMWDD